MSDSEISVKMKRVGAYLDRHGLDGVFLRQRGNFAWITGGHDNHVANCFQTGVAAVLATRDGRVCVTNGIEAPRFAAEEVPGMKVASYLWHDKTAAKKVLKELIAGRKIAADLDDVGEFDFMGAGFVRLPGDFTQIRWQLTDEEVLRYREGSHRLVAAMEATCALIKHGCSEHDVAGVLDDQVHHQGLNPVVSLVAADERIERFRHPIATDAKVRGYAMIVSCAEYGGMISNLTRFVSFGAIKPDLAKRFQAVCNVDTAVNLATRPGRTLGQLFDLLGKAYAAQGFPGECDKHHQGGIAGYACREAFALPDSTIEVMANEAFAWNLSLPGVKCEDTILCTDKGIEVLTVATADWPKITGVYEGQTLARPGVLIR